MGTPMTPTCTPYAIAQPLLIGPQPLLGLLGLVS